jgi:hypothetical protein
MKIYKHDYIFFIRLTFKRRGNKNLYLPLIETNLNETEEMLQKAIRSAKIDPLTKCNTTTVEMREATGGKNGAYRQISFKGLSPEDTKELVINYIDNLNKPKTEA